MVVLQNANGRDLVRCVVTRKRPALFRGRHFEDVIILLCVRWYLRYSLTYRDLKEIMAERGLSVDHVTIWRWVQHYG
jgi:transposase-like protein